MVFKGTITIEWNGLGQPLGSMVFQWFWGQATIGFNGFRWLSAIDPTMEWLHTIVEVYNCALGEQELVSKQPAESASSSAPSLPSP